MNCVAIEIFEAEKTLCGLAEGFARGAVRRCSSVAGRNGSRSGRDSWHGAGRVGVVATQIGKEVHRDW